MFFTFLICPPSWKKQVSFSALTTNFTGDVITKAMCCLIIKFHSFFYVCSINTFFLFKGLVARCHSFYLFFTLIEQTYNILYILLVEHHSCCPHCFPLSRGPPLGCRAEIRTQACRMQAGALYYLSHTAP